MFGILFASFKIQRSAQVHPTVTKRERERAFALDLTLL